MSEKKKKYGVSVVWTCSKYREIEAHSKEEAEQIAEDEIDEPSICHQCSREIESDLNYLETIVEEIEAVSSELDQLRADLEVMERYGLSGFAWTVRKKIAALEAEAADPHKRAKFLIDCWRNSGSMPLITVFCNHLTAENARLEKRVAEFRHGLACMVTTYGKIDERSEIAVKHARKLIECEGEEIDVSFYVKDVADMQPPFEGPIVGLEPILDPARVLATAAIRLDEMQISGGAYLRNYAEGATPYRMSDRVVPFGFDDGPVVELKRTIATAKNIVEAAGWLETADHLKRFLAEMGGKNSIPYRTKGEINELA